LGTLNFESNFSVDVRRVRLERKKWKRKSVGSQRKRLRRLRPIFILRITQKIPKRDGTHEGVENVRPPSVTDAHSRFVFFGCSGKGWEYYTRECRVEKSRANRSTRSVPPYGADEGQGQKTRKNNKNNKTKRTANVAG
jgi:hypothetical protein